MPNEPAESDFRTKVRAVCVPDARARRHRLGVPGSTCNAASAAGSRAQHAWRRAGRGQRDPARLQLAPGTRRRHRHQPPCFLHLGAIEPEAVAPGTFAYYTVKDARRGTRSWTPITARCMARIDRPTKAIFTGAFAQFLFPFYAMIPTAYSDSRCSRARGCPLTTSTCCSSAWGSRAGSVQRAQVSANRGNGAAVRRQAGESLLPTPRLVRSFSTRRELEHDYMIDRDKQRRRADYTAFRASTPRIRPSPKAWARFTTARKSGLAQRRDGDPPCGGGSWMRRGHSPNVA